MPILSGNVDKKSIEKVFSIAICRPTGDKWQSKTLFLSIFIRIRRLLITFSIAAYAVCLCLCPFMIFYNYLTDEERTGCSIAFINRNCLSQFRRIRHWMYIEGQF